MTMRETMARSMYERMCSRVKLPSDVGPLHGWENQSPELRADWLAAVEAALDALMEPTDTVLDVGARLLEQDFPDIDFHVAIVEPWRAMIRAARDGEVTPPA